MGLPDSEFEAVLNTAREGFVLTLFAEPEPGKCWPPLS
jgi:hypothetical protein